MPVFLSSTACTPSPPLCSHQDPSPGSLLRPFSCGTSLFLSRRPAPSAHPSFPCHSVPLSPVMLRRTLRSVQAFRPTPTVPRVLPFHRCRFLSSRGDRHFSPPSVHYPVRSGFGTNARIWCVAISVSWTPSGLFPFLSDLVRVPHSNASPCLSFLPFLGCGPFLPFLCLAREGCCSPTTFNRLISFSFLFFLSFFSFPFLFRLSAVRICIRSYFLIVFFSLVIYFISLFFVDLFRLANFRFSLSFSLFALLFLERHNSCVFLSR